MVMILAPKKDSKEAQAPHPGGRKERAARS
jgi:hypothetical protein